MTIFIYDENLLFFALHCLSTFPFLLTHLGNWLATIWRTKVPLISNLSLPLFYSPLHIHPFLFLHSQVNTATVDSMVNRKQKWRNFTTEDGLKVDGSASPMSASYSKLHTSRTIHSLHIYEKWNGASFKGQLE
jgi:hypothetical protein